MKNFLVTNKKVISINIIIVILLIIAPSLIISSYRKIINLLYKLEIIKINTYDNRANYIVYPDKEFSHELFSEFKKIGSEYRSFIGWKRKKAKYKYTNIQGKYNTRLSKGDLINNSNWFFGGSTMWGTGSRDYGTIPSIYNYLTDTNVINFGESGWNSRQSLNQYLSVLGDGHKPIKVIFYDGVNDVIHGCRSELNNVPSHEQEGVISTALEKKSNDIIFIAWNNILDSYKLIGRKVGIKMSYKTHKKGYNCHTNNSKAKKIASHLVNNWYSAYLITKQSKANFYAVLQPTLYSSESLYSYFPEHERENIEYKRNQFTTVYPLIIKEIERKCLLDQSFCKSFIDGTKWITKDSKVFIDFCHVTEEGNYMIVKNMIAQIKSRTK